MKITGECPHCQKKLAAPNHLAGKKIKCPACRSFWIVPNPSPALPDDRSSLSTLSRRLSSNTEAIPILEAGGSVLELRMTFPQISWLLFFCTPVAVLDGKTCATGWGTHLIQIPVGDHELEVSHSYLFWKKYGNSSACFSIVPGQRLRAYYYTCGKGALDVFEGEWPAGPFHRLLAFMLDFSLFWIPVGILTKQDIEPTGIFVVGVLIAYSIYEVGFLASPLRATVGRLICGVRVVDEKENTLSFLKSLLRFVVKILSPLFTLNVAIIVPFLARGNRAVHEMLTKTRSIRRLQRVKRPEQHKQNAAAVPHLTSVRFNCPSCSASQELHGSGEETIQHTCSKCGKSFNLEIED